MLAGGLNVGRPRGLEPGVASSKRISFLVKIKCGRNGATEPWGGLDDPGAGASVESLSERLE
jgi:hypothetical protein